MAKKKDRIYTGKNMSVVIEDVTEAANKDIHEGEKGKSKYDLLLMHKSGVKTGYRFDNEDERNECFNGIVESSDALSYSDINIAVDVSELVAISKRDENLIGVLSLVYKSGGGSETGYTLGDRDKAYNAIVKKLNEG